MTDLTVVTRYQSRLATNGTYGVYDTLTREFAAFGSRANSADMVDGYITRGNAGEDIHPRLGWSSPDAYAFAEPEPTPTAETVDWAVEDTAIREEFPGPIKDAALAKLRALVRERNTLKAKLAEPIGMDDQRIRPLFAKAAAEADEQGYCTVYDQISSAVGIPDRDTLRAEGWLEFPEWDVEYYVDYTYTVTDRVLVSERVSASDSGEAVAVAGEDSDTMEELVRNTADDIPEDATLTEVSYHSHYDTQRVRD